MPKIVKPLSDREIKTAKAKEKDYRLFDGQGLFLLVKTNGTKVFRVNFKFNNKNLTKSLGKYPDITLAEARKQKMDIKEKVKNGLDPRIEHAISTDELTLNDVIDEWIEVVKPSWAAATFKKNRLVFDKNIVPYTGKLQISTLKRKNIIEDLNRIQSRGANETANRLITQLDRVFRFAVTNEYIEHNIIADIDKTAILKNHKRNHFAAITKPKEIKKLMLDIKNYRFDYAADLGVAIALELAPYLIFRPLNIRALEKSEINFDEKYIFIPGEKMKSGEDFIMPVSDRVIAKLKEAISLDYRDSIYVFPSPRSAEKPLSDNTLTSALKRMGYREKHTIHGFRSTFSTNAHEKMKVHEFGTEIIESCLAHADMNKIRAAYNRSDKMKYFEEKKELMQWYENWLENLE